MALCTQFDLDFWNAGGRFPDALPRDGQAYLSEIILNTETGEASRHQVTQDYGEFPGVAQHVAGRPCLPAFPTLVCNQQQSYCLQAAPGYAENGQL